MFKIFCLVVFLVASIEFCSTVTLEPTTQEVLQMSHHVKGPVKLYEVQTKSHSLEKVQKMAKMMNKFQEYLLNMDEYAPVTMITTESAKDVSIKSLSIESFKEKVVSQVADDENGEESEGNDGGDEEDDSMSAVLEVLDYFNTIYTVRVDFNGDQIDTIMDTGSTNIAVNSNLCETPGCTTSKHVTAIVAEDGDHFSDLSDYILALSDEWVITYASGSLSCRLGLGRVTMGEVEVPDQEMCLFTDEEDVLDEDDIFQSIFGLSLWEGDEECESFMENIMEYNDKVYPVMTFALSRDFNGYGVMTIGEISSDLYEGDLVYHDTLIKPYWTLNLENVLIGGEDIGLCSGSDDNCGLVVDTGSSYNAMPTSSAIALLKYFNSLGVSCKEYNDYPDITYVIDGYEYTLKAYEYLTIVGDFYSSMYDSTVSSDAITDCFINLYTLDYSYKGYTLWLVGDVFISKFYTIFDFETEQVAFGDRSW